MYDAFGGYLLPFSFCSSPIVLASPYIARDTFMALILVVNVTNIHSLKQAAPRPCVLLVSKQVEMPLPIITVKGLTAKCGP
jgi:hypothetical protein